MSQRAFQALGGLRTVSNFKEHCASLGLDIPCDEQLAVGPGAPLAQSLEVDGLTIGNRFCIHPMEGWDGTSAGQPGEATIRRWRNFGLSGAKLIWGGEAVAVRHDGRANPNQLLASVENKSGLAQLRETVLSAHREISNTTDDLVIGLQLTHSGRFSRPNQKTVPEPRILYHHPNLDRKVGIDESFPVLSDGEIRQIIDDFIAAAKMAADLGYDFVDIKHCHGYLGHEFLSAHTRPGEFGGSLENRTRFLREIVHGIRSVAPRLKIGVRLSAFDLVPYRPDPERTNGNKMGPGIPENYRGQLPYRWGFGVDSLEPERYDLSETRELLSMFRTLGIKLLNITAGSPYYNPHIQRPALYPPSDGYTPPEDPLIGVARQMAATRGLKNEFPDLVFVGTAYTYLQEFLPFVAQAAVKDNWVDVVGLGRMVLSYPELPLDVLRGETLKHKRICRTFSDCTTGPRNGLPSGCYPLDHFYRDSEFGARLKLIKFQRR